MLRTRKTVLATALVAAVAAAAAGCSSSQATSQTSGGQSGGPSAQKTVTIGVLTDLTGLASASDKWAVEGVKAGVVAAGRAGYRVNYVVADTASNPATVLTAAKKLVEQDHVLAVVSNTALLFAAAPYLTQAGIPVIGAAQDGPEWTTSKNMFGVFGNLHAEKVTDTAGQFFKMQGATKIGSLGYGISPISKKAAEAVIASAQSVGLQTPYLNANFAFGSTDVQPVALAMRDAEVNGMSTSVTSATTFSLITALRNLGVDLKVAINSTGYGEILDAGAATLQAAEGSYFSMGYEPIELNTPATKQFVADLKAAGVSQPPGYGMYNGYASVLLLDEALKTAGDSPTHASLITALSNIHDFTAGGLFGGHKLDVNDRENQVSGVDNCQWFLQLKDGKFVPVPKAVPLCGKVLPGKTVS